MYSEQLHRNIKVLSTRVCVYERLQQHILVLYRSVVLLNSVNKAEIEGDLVIDHFQDCGNLFLGLRPK